MHARLTLSPSLPCLSVCLSVCLYVCLSVCLSVCLRSVQQKLFGTDPTNPRELGGLVWNACVLMARFVHQQLAAEGCEGEGGLRGVRALELGAGLGVVGLAAAQRGAEVSLSL